MFKKIGIPIFAVLAFMVLLAPTHANAGVRFGVTVGPPVYYAPPYVYSYPYPYYDPYAYGYAYPRYYYRYPYYSGYPYYGGSFYWRGGHERWERRGEFRERGFRDGRRFRR
jgi:hypothetical protein